jgi:hypothetical protein
MTEPESPGTTAGEGTPSLEAAPRSLAFTDAASAKLWVNGLPLTSISLVCETLLGQLKALAAARISPRARATIAEVLRDLIAHLHKELARRYAGKSQPAGDRELEAAENAIALWQGLWEQYSACLKPLLEGDPELVGVRPKILQRGMYVGKQLVLAHGLARRTVPEAVWTELHAYFRLTELLDCAGTAVSDNLVPNALGNSCYSTYSHALLLGLADACAMSVKQIELTDRWLAMWARKVYPYGEPRDNEGPVVIVDLERGEGATIAASVPHTPSPSLRFGYAGKLATSVRGRLKRLQSGASPAELQLGHDCSLEQCVAVLTHLDVRWCQAPRPEPEAPASTVDLCGGGLPAAYFRVGGRVFERKDPAARLTYRETQQLHALRPVVEHDPRRDDAEREWAWERWHGACQSREASIARVSGDRHRWSLEQLAILRSGERLRVGHTTRVAFGPRSELSLSLRLWPGAPQALALLPLSAAGASGATPVPALMLAATPEDRAFLVLPPQTFSPSRVLRSMDEGGERRLRLTKLLQRGADFERVAFDESA